MFSVWNWIFLISAEESDSLKANFTDDLADSSSATYAVFISYAEIYNEFIYDLLDCNIISKNGKRNPLGLGEDKLGAIYIKGM